MVFPQLKQKIVLVIGGAQGIGAAVRRTFLTESAVVIDADRQYKDTFSQTSANSYQCFLDICEEASVLRLRDELVKRQLVPDVLIHVAGISIMDDFLASQTEDFDRVFAVNTRGAYLVLRTFTAEMKQAKKAGRVVVIASQAGKNPYRGMTAYVASKHAVIGLTKNLALEVAADGIQVNAVCPGIIETEMKQRERVDGAKLRGLTVAEIEAEDASQVPLRRTGTPQDVANVVLFLASPLASYLTGQAINVTGGMTMHG